MTQDQEAFESDLDELEYRYASDPHFIDRAAHILLVGDRWIKTEKVHLFEAKFQLRFMMSIDI